MIIDPPAQELEQPVLAHPLRQLDEEHRAALVDRRSEQLRLAGVGRRYRERRRQVRVIVVLPGRLLDGRATVVRLPEPFGVRGEALVEPDVVPLVGRHGVAEPLVGELVGDDDVPGPPRQQSRPSAPPGSGTRERGARAREPRCSPRSRTGTGRSAPEEPDHLGEADERVARRARWFPPARRRGSAGRRRPPGRGRSRRSPTSSGTVDIGSSASHRNVDVAPSSVRRTSRPLLTASSGASTVAVIENVALSDGWSLDGNHVDAPTGSATTTE